VADDVEFEFKLFDGDKPVEIFRSAEDAVSAVSVIVSSLPRGVTIKAGIDKDVAFMAIVDEDYDIQMETPVECLLPLANEVGAYALRISGPFMKMGDPVQRNLTKFNVLLRDLKKLADNPVEESEDAHTV
jgi:hypothetical protein